MSADLETEAPGRLERVSRPAARDAQLPAAQPQHLLEKGFDKMLDASMLRSDLIYLLVMADKEQNLEAPGSHWENYYADFFIGRYL